MTQLPLLSDVQIKQRPRKHTTGTSRASIREFEASGKADAIRRLVLRAIRAMWNRTQESPTADEIADYLRLDLGIVRSRLTELERGWYVPVAGQKQRRQEGGGLIEKAGRRISARSGRLVHTWRAVERGTGK